MNSRKLDPRFLVVAMLVSLAGLGPALVWAQESERPPASQDIVITEAEVQVPIPGKNLTSAYFLLRNKGQHPRHLVGVQADFADRAELHSHEMKDGMARMRRQDSVTIAPRSELRFKSGGHHVMLFDLSRRPRTGDRLELVLEFRDGSQARVNAQAVSVFDRPHH